MIFYPCQLTGNDYDAIKVANASRLANHPDEPSWGVYSVQIWKEEAPDYVTAVFCDCDIEDAKDRTFTVRGKTWVYEGSEEL